MTQPESTVCGWGRLGVAGREVCSDDLLRLSERAILFRGLGRSYGDSSLPPPSAPEVACTVLGDRLIDFDETTGQLRAEAGVSLASLVDLFLPRGWFVPVTPGTRFVTLGGMVAADVHGKNHHVDGCIGAYVDALRLRTADGRIVDCSPREEAEFFHATVGGMGLTGHILQVTLRLARVPSPWIERESVRASGIDALLEALESSSAGWPFTVAWADLLARGARLGRGIVYRGRWTEPARAPQGTPVAPSAIDVPCEAPDWLLNRTSIGLFNAARYRLHGGGVRRAVESPYSFFYPLDRIANWNRLYGGRGLTQYQCVIPDSRGVEGVHQVLGFIARRRAPVFLCVIKNCGDEGRGLLSFPFRGMSVALDLPVGDGIQELIDALNGLVIDLGGRVYLAKDAFTRPEHFRAMEPRLDRWMAVRRRWDPERRLRSAQSVRLLGDPA